MWRKQNETKPSDRAPEIAEHSATKPQAVEVVQQSSSPVPISRPSISVPEPASRKTMAPASSSASVIGPGLKIRGEISGNSDLYIDGDTQGKIQISGARVTVGPKGKVQADVDAREIIVEGSLQGNLKATESVHLGASSQVQGSVLTPRIGIEDGARLRGKVEMVRAPESKPVPAPTKTTVATATTVAETLPANAVAVPAVSSTNV